MEGPVTGVRSGQWQHGTAILGAGTIDFQRGIPGGRGRRPGSSAVHLVGVTVGPERGRTRGLEIVSTVGTVLDLRTPDARLEWVVEPGRADWAVAQLSPVP